MPNMPSRARPAVEPLTSRRAISWGPQPVPAQPVVSGLDAPVCPLAPPAPVPGGFGPEASPDVLTLRLPRLPVLLRVLLRGGQQLERLALLAALVGQRGAHRPERLVLDLLVQLEDGVDEHLGPRRAAREVHVDGHDV